MAISLYDISAEVLALDELLEENGGEICEASEELQLHIAGLLEAKTDSFVGFCNKLDDEIELANKHIKRLQDYKKVRENNIERLKNYALLCLEKIGQKSFKGQMCEIKKTTPGIKLKITDVNKIPVQFTSVETVVNIDNKAVKDALKGGEIVDGACLETGRQSVSFKMKKVE